MGLHSFSAGESRSGAGGIQGREAGAVSRGLWAGSHGAPPPVHAQAAARNGEPPLPLTT